MPISGHFGGHGAAVMKAMKKTYGSGDKAKSVFYATENKKKASKSAARKSAGK